MNLGISILFIVLIASILPVWLILDMRQLAKEPLPRVSLLLGDLALKGFGEVELKMFETGTIFEDGPYQYLQKYVSGTIYKDCRVIIYTNLYKQHPSSDFYHPASSSIRIMFESTIQSKYKSSFSEWSLRGVIKADGTINKTHLDFLYEFYLRAPTINLVAPSPIERLYYNAILPSPNITTPARTKQL